MSLFITFIFARQNCCICTPLKVVLSNKGVDTQIPALLGGMALEPRPLHLGTGLAPTTWARAGIRKSKSDIYWAVWSPVDRMNHCQKIWLTAQVLVGYAFRSSQGVLSSNCEQTRRVPCCSTPTRGGERWLYVKGVAPSFTPIHTCSYKTTACIVVPWMDIFSTKWYKENRFSRHRLSGGHNRFTQPKQTGPFGAPLNSAGGTL